MFYRLFLSDACLGKACYEKCKYKYDQSSADIRIGDAWGPTYRDNEKGVNGVVTFTKKGDDILQSLNCELVVHPIDIVGERQMKSCPVKPWYTDKVWNCIRNENIPLSEASKYPERELRKRRWIGRINHLFQLLKIRYKIK